MIPQSKPNYGFADWLAHEREQQGRTEYLNGEVFAMSGASEAHNLIVANIIAELYVRGGQDHWTVSYYEKLSASIALRALQCSLSLTELYGKIDF